MEGLKDILRELNSAKITNNAVVVNKRRSAEQLVNLLKEEQLLKIIKVTADTIVVKPSSEAVKFSAVTQVFSVSRNELLQLATALLPSITGHIILTTRVGVLLHHQALERRIGGQVIGMAV